MIDLSQIPFDEHEPSEQAVQFFLEKIRRGEGLPPARLWRMPDGRYAVVDGYSRLEAPRRCGEDSVQCRVIEEPFDEARLLEARHALNAKRPNKND